MPKRLIGLAVVLAVISFTFSPLCADAQQRTNLPRIMVFSLSSPPDHVRAFEEGLRVLGYTHGTTIAIDHRSAEGRAATLPALAREVVALHPQVIVAIGTTAAIAAQQATKDLPIVAVTGDIVVAGLVGNLARPEGNVTGLSFFGGDLMLKRFDLLMELAPRIRRLAVLFQSPLTPATTKGLTALRTAAGKRGVEVREVPIVRLEDVKAAFAKVRGSTVDGLLLQQAPTLDARAEEIGQLAAEHRLIAKGAWPNDPAVAAATGG